ncbi:MAG: UDP-N-acetylmuramoyl-L-alanine--D-glutamate ligase [Gammaproteobacteria bacterium]|nr:MAG: UDP-N-acetylmuramoyl-L-alanine--D-glutamate ligase [Gammaproteobacteria bacterium]
MISSSRDTARLSLVVGLGVSGWSCVRFLMAQGFNVAVTDSRDITPYSADLRQQFPEITCALGGFDSALFNVADEIIVSPGIALDTPEIMAARAAGKRIIGDIELFSRYAVAPVVAITGSNGKSTVTTLLGKMAVADGVKVAVGGNIGIPALDLLADDPELYVLELSSFQLDLTSSLKTKTAVVLNVTADHLDRHASMQVYAETKLTVYKDCMHPVANNDFIASTQRYLPVMSQYLAEAAINYSLAEPVFDSDFGLHELNGEKYLARGRRNLLLLSDLGIKGTHNVSNALAALAMGSVLGLSESAMLDTLKTFTGLPHRCELVAVVNDVMFINDSKGTNVDASIAAINSLDTPLVLIAGGDAKGADLSPLRDIAIGRVKTVITIGKAAAEIENLLLGVINTIRAYDMKEAVQEAAACAETGGTVLLSPACSSLDMFSSYEARGNAFVEAVRGLQQ